MRAAPAISAPLDDCRPERVVIALLYGTTGATLAGWAAGHNPSGISPFWPVLGLLFGSLAGWGLARQLLPGDLSQIGWDGTTWSAQRRLPAAAAETFALTDLRRVFDLGPWVLLRASEGPGRRHWLVLRERRVGAGWHLLRVALAAHARGRP